METLTSSSCVDCKERGVGKRICWLSRNEVQVVKGTDGMDYWAVYQYGETRSTVYSMISEESGRNVQ